MKHSKTIGKSQVMANLSLWGLTAERIDKQWVLSNGEKYASLLDIYKIYNIYTARAAKQAETDRLAEEARIASAKEVEEQKAMAEGVFNAD
jgi:hypothetical protein